MGSCSLSYVIHLQDILAYREVSTNHTFSSMAGTVISGELGQKYGFFSLSMYAGASLLLGSVILLAAKFAQNRRLAAIV